MGVAYLFNVSTTAASDIDLTAIATNPDVWPVATPRAGGFTLRNRINASNLATAATYLLDPADFDSGTAATVTQRMRILEVPKRTIVRHVSIQSVPGQTAPDTAFASVSNVNASFASGLDLQIGAAHWKETGQSTLKYQTAYTDDLTGITASGASGAVFGQAPMTKATGVTVALPSKVSTSSSTPWKGIWNVGFPKALQASGSVNAFGGGEVFPYGGYVTMHMGPDSQATSSVAEAASSDSVNLVISGVWDIVAICDYIPE